MGFNSLEKIRLTEIAAINENNLSPSIEQDWFDHGVRLAHELWVARGPKKYSDDLSNSVMIIFVKAMNDCLATALLSGAGYHLPAIATLRGAFEAAELMDYLLAHANETADWLNKAQRFDSLSWLRQHLPKRDDRDTLYDFMNNSLHCNASETIAWTSRTQPNGQDSLLIGPVKLDPHTGPTGPEAVHPALYFLARVIPYVIRVLLRHDPSVVPDEWVRRFYDFDSSLDFPFGDPWSP